MSDGNRCSGTRATSMKPKRAVRGGNDRTRVALQAQRVVGGTQIG